MEPDSPLTRTLYSSLKFKGVLTLALMVAQEAQSTTSLKETLELSGFAKAPSEVAQGGP